MKKITAIVLSLILTIPSIVISYGNTFTDNLVFSAEIENTYLGRQDATTLTNNLRYNDLNNHWGHESVIHGGSLGIIRATGGNFNPNATVSNLEAISFAVRLAGLGSEAQAAAVNLDDELYVGLNLNDTLGLGYLDVARQNDIITTEEFEELAGVEVIFTGNDPVTREQMATWTARALVAADNESINVENEPKTILSFGDWQSISLIAVPYVEALTSAGVMNADSSGNFNPKGSLTQAEMSQILRNLDNTYYNIAEIERKTGTVAAFRDNQEVTTLQGNVWRNYYIRTSTGEVDVLQHQIIQTPSGQTIDSNTIVFKNGQVGGFELLIPGEQIEYLVKIEDNTVLYINVVNTQQVISNVEGRLQSINFEEGTITIRDENGRDFNYNMVEGMYGEDNDGQYIYLDRMKTYKDNFPVGSIVEIGLINNLANELSFIGQPVHTLEMRGIVIENNPGFGYLTVIDNNGNIVTRYYHSNNIRVQREDYYQTTNNIGYISQMFPNFQYNPLEASITDLVPGDIVFMRFDPNDPTAIVNISAAANYTTKHGLVRQVSTHNNSTQILVQYDNNQTSWFELPQGIFVSKQGRPVAHSEIEVGDRVRLLVNQAIIGPGHIMESILEVTIEGDGHHISTIMTGSLSGFNPVQNQMMVNNARVLTKTGWGPHSQIEQLNTSSRDIEFYHEDQRISLDHATRFLSRSDVDIYVALDNSPTGDKIRKVTFRNGRDELLKPDTVISADGNGNFQISSVSGPISTDSGTIVRRNGKMITGADINTGDLVTVSLNGGNRAAVVDITEAPAVSAVNIARARILSVNEGRSFTVQSMSVLSGNDWIFTPIEREFTIGPNTLFLNEGGYEDPTSFIDYTEFSVADSVYTIIYDGSMATHVINAPHANSSVRGNIYGIVNNNLQIKNAQYLDNETAVWQDISRIDATMQVSTHPNTIIVKNNRVVQLRDLQEGDQIRVLTTNLPTMGSGVSVPGYIILVES